MRFQHYHNNYKKLLTVMVLLSSFFLQSQIVNIENLRHNIDSLGWSGHARLDLQLEKNNANRILNFSNQLRLQYKAQKSTWFLIHDMALKEFNGSQIINNSTQHLRFSHELSSKISYEAFLQSQSDRISEIRLRFLAGTGLRFNLYKTEKTKAFLGATVMYEYENSVHEVESIHNDLRNSLYFSFKLKPTENISIVSTNYYQPLFNNFSDYRILSETSLMFKVIKNLKFITTIHYVFDSFPVATVAKEQYKISNGLVYFFD